MNAESPIKAETARSSRITAQRRRIRLVLMIGGPALVIAVALYFYLTGGRIESTDNASLQTGMVAISPNVAGTVVEIAVEENQRVKRGDLLFRIKADTLRNEVALAEAELVEARSDVASLEADYKEAQSQISAARARYDLARNDAKRQRSLLDEGIASRAQYDAAQTEVRTARDAIAAAQAKAEGLRAQLAKMAGGGIDAEPGVRAAAARLAQAKIKLGDAEVRAPKDGIVTRVNQLQVGSYVSPGKPVFMLTGLRFWVQANFKEDQLRYMRVGQPAEVKVDAFPDHVLKGRVESFSPGTGSSFSVLPAENATGNWVKVVQRLPVQIAIAEVPSGLPMSAGLSAQVEVDTGHERHLFGPDTVAAAPAGK
ncbi:secretion protein HlyD [Novosphingobium sp. PC22D]|uniref:HlyD family secretion protein n=1 Tax=Novosphingobium sp. PC22D TaxID=1962403 RepID=UPI000BF001B3|nr:HlyD family secretion protein [Novosphingobium sp. PC22D]PEQ10643.1 secretion protein HlyD [Novosphingobium sp. PC22D]